MSGFINPNDLETFLQLDDLKGNFAEDLQRMQAEKEPEVEIDDTFPADTEFADGDEDYSVDRFRNKEGGLTFEGEDGWEEETEEIIISEENTVENELMKEDIIEQEQIKTPEEGSCLP